MKIWWIEPSTELAGHVLHHGRKELDELSFAHFAAAHDEVAMVNAAEPADITVDRYVVRRICECELRLLAFEQHLVFGRVARVPAPQPMLAEQP
jgi:hypothetical protein